MGPGLADRCPDRLAFVAAEVVHDYDVARMQSGYQGILDIGTELNAIDRPIEEDGSLDAVLS